MREKSERRIARAIFDGLPIIAITDWLTTLTTHISLRYQRFDDSRIRWFRTLPFDIARRFYASVHRHGCAPLHSEQVAYKRKATERRRRGKFVENYTRNGNEKLRAMRPMVLFPNINSNLVTWSHRLLIRCETKARCIETDRGRRDEDVNCDARHGRSEVSSSMASSSSRSPLRFADWFRQT